jgi:hypothetical protein
VTLLGSMVLLHCGNTLPAKHASPSAHTARPIERFFPLQDGHVYTYDIVSPPGAPREQFIVRIRRRSADRAEMLTGGAVRQIVLEEDGIRREDAGYVLRVPLRVGATWQGDNGGTATVEATDVEAQVPAGSFKGCVRVVERLTTAERKVITTVLCEGVGIVTMQVQASSGSEQAVQRVELRFYGPPVDLEAKD